ncbi:hypothetical protein BS78_06G040000 [Paspalum vaginatum]|nr:hypothetical protein BS78_06G040000 [Paspalum vaginatum]
MLVAVGSCGNAAALVARHYRVCVVRLVTRHRLDRLRADSAISVSFSPSRTRPPPLRFGGDSSSPLRFGDDSEIVTSSAPIRRRLRDCGLILSDSAAICRLQPRPLRFSGDYYDTRVGSYGDSGVVCSESLPYGRFADVNETLMEKSVGRGRVMVARRECWLELEGDAWHCTAVLHCM